MLSVATFAKKTLIVMIPPDIVNRNIKLLLRKSNENSASEQIQLYYDS